MPMLYLFTIQNLNCYPNDKNCAIISEDIQDKLEELNEGDTTSFFNESGLEKDIIKYKLVVPFSINCYNEIIANYIKTSRILIEKDKKEFWCVIDDERQYIGNYPFDESNMTFDYIGIY